jgi:hypothetical protein
MFHIKPKFSNDKKKLNLNVGHLLTNLAGPRFIRSGYGYYIRKCSEYLQFKFNLYENLQLALHYGNKYVKKPVFFNGLIMKNATCINQNCLRYLVLPTILKTQGVLVQREITLVMFGLNNVSNFD